MLTYKITSPLSCYYGKIQSEERRRRLKHTPHNNENDEGTITVGTYK